MPRALVKFDKSFIRLLKRNSGALARAALFIVYFWFGALKLFGASPANPLIAELLGRTIPWISFDAFIVGFAMYEMLIGLFFLAPGLERVAIALLVPHLLMTALPLLVLPSLTWQGFFMPTLEGQYIVKNLLIVALAFGIAAQMIPMRLARPAPKAAQKKPDS
jgi:uncharacterized membrane protein YkgB